MSEREYITCRELIGFIADYLEGQLGSAERAEFERHLAVCPSCVAYLDGYRHTIELGKAALQSAEEPAEPMPEPLVRAILQARRTRLS